MWIVGIIVQLLHITPQGIKITPEGGGSGANTSPTTPNPIVRE